MLKFSGFADLTSCQGNGQGGRRNPEKGAGTEGSKTTYNAPKVFCQLLADDGQMHFMHQGLEAPWCTDTSHQHGELRSQWQGNPLVA